MNKILMSFKIAKALKNKLAKVAIKKGVSMSALINLMISEYVEKEVKK